MNLTIDHVLRLVDYFVITRGALFSFLFLSLFLLLPRRIKRQFSNLMEYRYDHTAMVLLATAGIAGLSYLAYPGYIDHVESTIASLGLVVRQGNSLYPLPDPFPFHGLLYGPVLAYTQAFLTPQHWPILLASKLPGLVAFLASVLLFLHANRDTLARGYLMYLLPFSFMLFWNRAEPFFLLLVAAGLLTGRIEHGSKYLRPIIMGVLAGAASGLKLHGAIYVLAAYLAATLGLSITIGSVLLFGLAAVLSFATGFLPQNISLISFGEYLRLASVHGLSPAMGLENIFYLLFLALPIVVLLRDRAGGVAVTGKIAAILLLELLVAIIGAKPGSGIHHLLPFVLVNAHVIGWLRAHKGRTDVSIVNIVYLSLIPSALMAIMPIFIILADNWERLDGAREEVVRFGQGYAAAVMGVADNRRYSLSFLHVLLSGRQIDYPGYMDLQFSGVGDDTMSRRMRDCEIPYFVMPNGGSPFSVSNFYTGRRLFSDEIRQSFAAHYVKVENGEYFSVYACNRTAARRDS